MKGKAMGIRLNEEYLKGFLNEEDILSQREVVEKCHTDLENKTGSGADFLGWVDLPEKTDDALVDELTKLGEEVRSHSDAVISIGIGGSYLGIRSTLEALRHDSFPVYYAGHNMSAEYMSWLLNEVKDKDLTVIVISKSGTTTEPALAFRLIKKLMKDKYSTDELKKRIICVTDASKGALRQVVDSEGYRSYVIPDDVGGRFSVLTPVGLVPLAIAGVDIKAFVEGFRAGQKEYSQMDLEKNICYHYALIRNLLYRQGKNIEVLSSFYDNMFYVAEWWKQLYGESEGKDGKGIFPASLILSTDLHSMGQLLQDGHRNIFETFLDIEQLSSKIEIPKDDKNLDNFNIVAGKDLDYVNQQAYKATAAAHFEGGVPSLTISLDKADAKHIGQLYYFYERGVAISGYLLHVNPFDQPGVEAYKKKMFALLGRV